MSTAISICHGQFGRATLYQLNRPFITHVHREGHLIFLIDGADSKVTVSGEPQNVRADSAVAVNPWEPHAFHPGDRRDGSIFLTMYIKPIWFLEVGRSAKSALRFGRSAIEMTPQISHSVQKVVTLLLEFSDTDLFDGYLYELTKECFDQSWQWTPTARPFANEFSMFTDFRVRKSMKLMSEHLGTDLELNEIARESGLSRPHFYKLFRKQTGITPNLFMNTLRMERAIEWLSESDKSITDIGYDLGFSCQSGFSRFFSTNVGMPPTDYRRVVHMVGN